MIYKIKRFSKVAKGKILETNGSSDFIRGRKYDTDMDRLSRRSVQNEINSVNQLNKEMRKASKELGM